MEIPLSGGKVRRWNFFTDLYHSGIDLGYSMIVAETALGRMTKKSPVGAFGTLVNQSGCLLAVGSMRSYRF